MRVAQRYLHRAVTQEIPHGVQRDPALDETGGEMVAEVVPTEMDDPGALEQFAQPF